MSHTLKRGSEEIPREQTRGLQLRNQAFRQLCRYLLADSRACKDVSHTQKSPRRRKKKKVRKEKNDVVPLLVIILAGSMNACSFRAVSTFRCVTSADRACAVILEPLVNAAGMEFVPTRKHTQDLSGLKVAHAYHT